MIDLYAPIVIASLKNSRHATDAEMHINESIIRATYTLNFTEYPNWLL